MDGLVLAFHDMYYRSLVWNHNTLYKGRPIQKMPSDLWIYAELIYKTKPDVIVEIGSWIGTSATWMGDQCSILNHGHVVTFEITANAAPAHPKVDFVHADALTDESRKIVDDAVVKYGNKVMIIDDGSHNPGDIKRALELYHDLVSVDSYFIVEDGNVIASTPIVIDEFLTTHPEFVIDKECEKFLVTFNPGGYLKKIA